MDKKKKYLLENSARLAKDIADLEYFLKQDEDIILEYLRANHKVFKKYLPSWVYKDPKILVEVCKIEEELDIDSGERAICTSLVTRNYDYTRYLTRPVISEILEINSFVNDPELMDHMLQMIDDDRELFLKFLAKTNNISGMTNMYSENYFDDEEIVSKVLYEKDGKVNVGVYPKLSTRFKEKKDIIHKIFFDNIDRVGGVILDAPEYIKKDKNYILQYLSYWENKKYYKYLDKKMMADRDIISVALLNFYNLDFIPDETLKDTVFMYKCIKKNKIDLLPVSYCAFMKLRLPSLLPHYLDYLHMDGFTSLIKVIIRKNVPIYISREISKFL